MASSKLKKPPALHQKRTTEEPASTENDLSVLTAFKKLKVDAEGGCVKKTEDQSKNILKHKPESTATEDGADHREEAKDAEGWSQSLKSFCLCDEGAVSKRGRSKWKSMCRFHQLRMRKDSSSRQNTLNLVQAVRAHKPLLQQSRFRAPDNKSPPQVLRSARFCFDLKSAKLSEGKGKPAPSETSAAAESETFKSSVCDKAGQESTSQTVFAAAASERLSDFSSLLTKGKKPADEGKKEPAPCFDNFRDGCDKHHGQKRGHQALWPEENTGESSKLSASGQGSGAAAAAAAAVSHRVDLAVERSCSQEARLDETECSVNELAAYFDHYFVIPKEMSSMAQMMYT